MATILFIHQNFPGQFKHLAPALVQQGHEVVALCMRDAMPGNWQGVRIVTYKAGRSSSTGIHPWVADMETKVIRGEACFRAALQLKAQGFMPHAIVAHPGWGESLFLKDVWPQARLGLYCEFFYHSNGADVGFDPEFAVTEPADVCRLRLKNLNHWAHFESADACISPTHWQASTFPQALRQKMTVVHDGIDTAALLPNPQVGLEFSTPVGKLALTRANEVITFVNRNLEPYRGYHVFMRALPALLRQRPNAQVVLVGGDSVSYGSRPPPAADGSPQSWKKIFAQEVRPQIPDADWARVHFMGYLPYAQFVALLQLSTVHVYLTYPFVLSWSLLEAMSLGCAIVASRTAPVLEAITDGETGRLVDFFDGNSLVQTTCNLLDNPTERARLGANARQFAQAQYDLQAVCLPRQLAWVNTLLQGG